METTKRQATHRPSSPQKLRLPGAKGSGGARDSTENHFAGFGASPPRKKQPQQQHGDLLKDAERLVQIVLGNDNEKLSKESIHKVIQKHAASQTKKRYSTLLEMPWRTTPAKWKPDGREEASESNIYERITHFDGKNPKTFRRTSSDMAGGMSTSMGRDPSERQGSVSSSHGESSWAVENSVHGVAALASQLDLSKLALEKANRRIASLQQEVSVLVQAADESESLLSINDNLGLDDDEDDDLTAKSVRPKPPLHVTTKHGGKEIVSRLDYQAATIRNAALQTKIDALEKQLAESEIQFHDEAKRKNRELDAMEKELADVESKLNGTEGQRDFKSSEMQAKIAKLEEELVYSEAKLTDAEEQQKAKNLAMHAQMESLERQLADYEAKLRETEEQARHQTAQQIVDTENLLKRKEKEVDAAKIEGAVAKAAAESAERRLKQLENLHHVVVEEMQGHLSKSESKTKFLHEELSNLMPLTTEMAQVKLDLRIAQTKLKKSEQALAQLQANENGTNRAVVEVQDAADARIIALEESLTAANERGRDAARRLEHLESAQAREQEILSEELRESETTIACLMEELDSLKPLAADLEKVERALQDTRSKHNMMELELAETRAALQQSVTEANDFRNELSLLLPLAADLDNAKRELQETRAKLELKEREVENLAERKNDDQKLRVSLQLAEDEVRYLRNALDLLKPLATDLENAERELQETRSALELKEHEIANMAETDDVCELRASLQLAEQEVDELRSELDLLKPLASDLENAERELRETRAKLELKEPGVASMADNDEVGALRAVLQRAEQEAYDLRKELDLLRPLSADLEEAERELRETRQKIADIENDARELRASLQRSEGEVAELQSELDLLKPLAADLEHAEQELDAMREKMAETEQQLSTTAKSINVDELTGSLQSVARQNVADLEKELGELRKQLAEDKARAALQQKELNDLQTQLERARVEISALEKKMSEVASSDAEVRHLRKLLDRKEREIESLNVEVAEQEKHITTTRMQVVEMDEERNYNRAKMMELSSLVAVRNKGDPEKRLVRKAAECAELIAERDNLRHRLTVVETKTIALEQENKEKKAMVQNMMSRGGDSSSSTEAFVESMEKEHDRTLKRCADLSLQLAESQFKIDELTDKLRKIQRNGPPPTDRHLILERAVSFQSPTRTESKRATFKALLNSGIDRLNTCMDDSLRAADESAFGRWGSKINNAVSSSASTRPTEM